MAIYFVYIINILFLLYSFFHLIRWYRFSRLNIAHTKNDTNLANIIVVIPCYKEQNIIEQTVQHFKDILPTNTKLILITTEKEKPNNTKKIIEERILPKYQNVFLEHYPKESGYMAHQLNFVLKNIDKYTDDQLENYFCVYNADSYPNTQTFNEVFTIIEQNNCPKIIQQYAYAFSNYNELNIILKGFAIYQSNFELKIGLLNSFYKNRFLHSHVVGHGLFIELNTLKKIKGFNTDYWCEDIYMGAYLKNNNIPITPTLTLETMETPNTLSNLIKQNGVWFSTAFKFIQIYKDIKAESGQISLMGLIGLINEFRAVMNWIMLPFIITLTIIIPIITNDWYLLIFSILCFIFYIWSISYTTIKIINKLSYTHYKLSVKLLIGAGLATLISNFGPLYHLLINPKEKHKTER